LEQGERCYSRESPTRSTAGELKNKDFKRQDLNDGESFWRGLFRSSWYLKPSTTYSIIIAIEVEKKI